MMQQNKPSIAQNLTEKNDIMYLLSLILGSLFFVLGFYYHLDGFIIIVVSMSLWIASAFYKGRNSSSITAGFFGTSLVVLAMTDSNIIDGFGGFFLVIILFFLGFAVWLNNSTVKTQQMDNELMLCQNCNQKVFVGTKFCPNCGKTLNNK